ncbi:MAG: DNA-binding transcriptional ArsR family regulator [Pseudohongiellaceae bacterium]|jgi:ArsR family transcriptional regulator
MKIDPNVMSENAGKAEQFLKQIANGKRLMVLCVLIDGELSVKELNVKIPISQSALSQHLSKLREAGFVSTRRESQTIYYQLADPRVKVIIQSLYQLFCLPEI